MRNSSTGIGDYVTSLKEVHRLAALVAAELKGDKPGHEFRGNQWEGGKGSASLGSVTSETYQGGKPIPKKIRDEISTTWEGERRIGGMNAATRRDNGDVVIGKDGKEAVLTIYFRPPQTTFASDVPAGEYKQIDSLATKRGGYGKKAMTLAAQNAAAEGKGLYLASREDAEGFYKKIGMKKAGKKVTAEQHFYWTPAQTAKIAAEGLGD